MELTQAKAIQLIELCGVVFDVSANCSIILECTYKNPNCKLPN